MNDLRYDFLAEAIIVKDSLIDDVPDILFPEEEMSLGNACMKRRREFNAGRWCARLALAELGIANFPVLRSMKRFPIWPPGIVGSIAHTDTYSIAAVGLQKHILGIGVDVEKVWRCQQSLWDLVFSEDEKSWLSCLHETAQVPAATLLFSAKECFYKYQFALTQANIDYREVVFQLASTDRGFRLTLSKCPLREVRSCHEVTVAWTYTNGMVVTAVCGNRDRRKDDRFLTHEQLIDDSSEFLSPVLVSEAILDDVRGRISDQPQSWNRFKSDHIEDNKDWL